MPSVPNRDNRQTASSTTPKPRKPANAWILYRAEKIKHVHLEPGKHHTPESKTRIVAKAWSQEPEEEKNKYRRRAKALMAEYKRAHPSESHRDKPQSSIKPVTTPQEAYEQMIAEELLRSWTAMPEHPFDLLPPLRPDNSAPMPVPAGEPSSMHWQIGSIAQPDYHASSNSGTRKRSLPDYISAVDGEYLDSAEIEMELGYPLSEFDFSATASLGSASYATEVGGMYWV